MLLQRSTLGVGSGVVGGSRRSSPCLHARPACGTAVAVGARQQGKGASRGSSVAVRGQEPGQEELPPWVRREKERELQAAKGAKGGVSLPWGLALLFSVFVAIAATGSIFEYQAGNPIFGLITSESPVWAPILLFMAITGYPMAGFLFKYGVDGFNQMAEDMDRMDGYRK